MSTTTPQGGLRLEAVTPDNWREFTEAPASVLVLGKTTCEACAVWSEELASYLAVNPEAHTEVRFGKLLLDQRGFVEFKRANPWLAEVTELPYNVIYRDGQLTKKYVGGGIERLTRRLGKVFDA